MADQVLTGNNTRIWSQSKTKEWVLYDVENELDNAYQVRNDDGQLILVQKKTSHHFHASHAVLHSNLAEMNSLHEAPMLDILRSRFIQGKIYTHVGDILLCINPNETFSDLYKLKNIEQTLTMDPTTPHIYGTAMLALHRLQSTHESQSMLISGESGAGKTKTANYIIQYLVYMTTKRSSPLNAAGSIEKCVIRSSCVLEAFGNATTPKNINSSRFGKYIKLFYSNDMQICGAQIRHFLLEKSRITSINDGHRNYHAFYHLCAAILADYFETEYKDFLSDSTIAYLCSNNVTNLGSLLQFKDLCDAMETLGIHTHHQRKIWNILIAILFLGELKLVENECQEATISEFHLEPLSKLLGVTTRALKKALCKRTMRVNLRDSFTEISLTVAEASLSRHSLAKGMYSYLFDWIVAEINNATKATFPEVVPKATSDETTNYIAILDIFGFESLEINSFEQLCINYANETLQKQFNKQIFIYEQEQYALEGLPGVSIEFQDNQPCIDLIEAKPCGLFRLLDEQAFLGICTSDENFLHKLHGAHLGKHPNYSKPRINDGKFILRHFAGDVCYTAASLLRKNKDNLHQDLVELMQNSSDSFIADQWKNGTDTSNARDRPNQKICGSRTVSKIFREQMADLLQEIESTNPAYVRCLKSNNEKLPKVWDSNLVLEQLKYLGVLEAIKMRQSGYPIRLPFAEFLERFNALIAQEKRQPYDSVAGTIPTQKELCIFILLRYCNHDWEVGAKKVFLKDFTMSLLIAAIRESQRIGAIKIQAVFKAHLAKQVYHRQCQMVMRLQSWLKTCYLQQLLKIMLKGFAVLSFEAKQFILRANMRRRNSAAILIQLRGKKFIEKRQQQELQRRVGASTAINSLVRGFIARARYMRMIKHVSLVTNWMRSNVVRKLYLRRIRSVRIVSAFLCSRSKRLKYLRMRRSMIFLQSYFRGYMVRKIHGKKARVLQALQKGSVIILVAAMRRYQARRNIFRYFLAVARLQACYKQHKCTNSYKHTKVCIIKLQTIIRRYQARQHYHNTLVKVGILQSFFRKQSLKLRSLRVKRGVIRFQAVYHGQLVRKHFFWRIECIVVLQRIGRCFIKSMRFKRMVRSAQCIQLWIRQHQKLAQKRKVNKAATILGAKWKGYITHLKFYRIMQAIIKTQAIWKGVSLRTYRTILSQHTIRMQSTIRGIQGRKLASLYRYSTIVICNRIWLWHTNRTLSLKIKKLYSMVRTNNLEEFVEFVSENPELVPIQCQARNYMSIGHVAILNNCQSIVSHLSTNFPQTLLVPDSKGNYALHYAAQTASILSMRQIFSAFNDNDQCTSVLDKKRTCLENQQSNDLAECSEKGIKQAMIHPRNKSGYLRLVSEPIQRKVFAILENMTLAIYKSANDVLPYRLIELDNIILNRESQFLHSFSLISPKLGTTDRLINKLTCATTYEYEAQEWFNILRTTQNVKVHTATLGCDKYVSVKCRSAFYHATNQKNYNKEYPLHLLIRNFKNKDDALMACSWMLGHGAISSVLDAQLATPYQLAISLKRPQLAAVLQRHEDYCHSRENEFPKSIRMHTPKDFSVDDSPESPHSTFLTKYVHLSLPTSIPNSTYLSIYVQNVTMYGSSSIKNPMLRISVERADRSLLECPQDLTSPLLQDKKGIFWGLSWHMQSALEALQNDACIVIQFYHRNLQQNENEVICWTRIPLENRIFNQEIHSVRISSPPICDEAKYLPGESSLSFETTVIST